MKTPYEYSGGGYFRKKGAGRQPIIHAPELVKELQGEVEGLREQADTDKSFILQYQIKEKKLQAKVGRLQYWLKQRDAENDRLREAIKLVENLRY